MLILDKWHSEIIILVLHDVFQRYVYDIFLKSNLLLGRNPT